MRAKAAAMRLAAAAAAAAAADAGSGGDCICGGGGCRAYLVPPLLHGELMGGAFAGQVLGVAGVWV